MRHSLTEKIGPWVDAAIDKHGQGENIVWASSLTPDQGRNPTFTITVWFPGGILGSTLLGSFQVNDPLGATEEKVSEVMAEFLRQLRENRSRQIAESGNGHRPPEDGHHPSGLILPT